MDWDGRRMGMDVGGDVGGDGDRSEDVGRDVRDIVYEGRHVGTDDPHLRDSGS